MRETPVHTHWLASLICGHRFPNPDNSFGNNISFRTIQRIENGESEARGDTLKRPASALNIDSEELTGRTEQEDKGNLAFLNLSALSFFASPLLGVVVPLASWLLKKDKITREAAENTLSGS